MDKTYYNRYNYTDNTDPLKTNGALVGNWVEERAWASSGPEANFPGWKEGEKYVRSHSKPDARDTQYVVADRTVQYKFESTNQTYGSAVADPHPSKGVREAAMDAVLREQARFAEGTSGATEWKSTTHSDFKGPSGFKENESYASGVDPSRAAQLAGDPVTVYSADAVEYYQTARSGQNPYGRDSNFTKPMKEWMQGDTK